MYAGTRGIQVVRQGGWIGGGGGGGTCHASKAKKLGFFYRHSGAQAESEEGRSVTGAVCGVLA